ncbi:MAG: hypothetical protein V3V08_24495 [Nannocystaceae bacterium]
MAACEPVLALADGAIETRAAYLWLRTTGVVCCVIKANVDMDLESSLEINAIIASFSDPPWRRPIPTDISAPHRTDPSVRRHARSAATLATTLKLGILVATPVARMLGNACVIAMRPPYPTRLFTAEGPATTWLEDGWATDG